MVYLSSLGKKNWKVSTAIRWGRQSAVYLRVDHNGLLGFLSLQDRQDVPGRFDSHAHDGFRRGSTDMGGQDKFARSAEAIQIFRGLLGECVQSGGSDDSPLQCVDEGFLINDLTPRRVDQPRRFLHHREFRSSDETPGPL